MTPSIHVYECYKVTNVSAESIMTPAAYHHLYWTWTQVLVRLTWTQSFNVVCRHYQFVPQRSSSVAFSVQLRQQLWHRAFIRLPLMWWRCGHGHDRGFVLKMTDTLMALSTTGDDVDSLAPLIMAATHAECVRRKCRRHEMDQAYQKFCEDGVVGRSCCWHNKDYITGVKRSNSNLTLSSIIDNGLINSATLHPSIRSITLFLCAWEKDEKTAAK